MPPDNAKLFDETIQVLVQVSGHDRAAIDRLEEAVTAGALLPEAREPEAIYTAGPGQVVGDDRTFLILNAFFRKCHHEDEATGEVLHRWVGDMTALYPTLHIHVATSPDERDHFNEYWSNDETGLVFRRFGDLDDEDGRAAMERCRLLIRNFEAAHMP